MHDPASEYFANFYINYVNPDDEGTNFDGNIPVELHSLIGREDERHAQPLKEEVISINLKDEDDPRMMQIVTTLSPRDHTALVDLLKEFFELWDIASSESTEKKSQTYLGESAGAVTPLLPRVYITYLAHQFRMAVQMELGELRKAVEELGHKMDKQMIMVQGLFGLVTSTALQPDMGLVKEPFQAYHLPTVGIKLCSGDMFKDLAEFHEARTHSKEDTGSLFKTIAKGEDMFSDEFSSKGKTMQPVDEDMCCNCKANRGPALNSQSGR
ncbi:hypothetical protein RHMOL_Rhmol05G0157100 [Rhododendron molle]|uniref:Uncharacterized protein n=1 Tax=Rhododendron molle TaxID=49168 RepID=A0ACC0NQI6_RHOML|nr:hypothetical protein RHMOL_Rhmol05G0157100 [Rhododendron molle]